MSGRKKILCIGEILWDSLPSGLYLGGAPLNVCYHLNQLGVKASIASSVGNDRLGREAIRRIETKKISSDLIQTDENHETGFVSVDLDESGDPAYEIIEPAAWDFIEPADSLREVAEQGWGLVFGSLAQRNPQSRATIRKLWELDIRKIMDMNLRAPFVDRQVIEESLEIADFVKMNEEELRQLQDWYGLSHEPSKAVEQLAKKFYSSAICITRGANGARMFNNGNWYEHMGFPVDTKDVVGAGDAFLAALLRGLYLDMNENNILAFANAAGALVASRFGATPEYTCGDIEDIMAKQQ